MFQGPDLPFDFYYRLPTPLRRLYERSDGLRAPRLPSDIFKPLIEALADALVADRQRAVTAAAQAVADTFVTELKLPPVKVLVRRTRPERGGSEYHGYYRGENEGSRAEVILWMYTARRRQVVAFRTFLRTLVHELCHHLDFEGFRLDQSFHTEGFYERESSLFRDIVGERLAGATSERRPK